jgi:hypothetical protein
VSTDTYLYALYARLRGRGALISKQNVVFFPLLLGFFSLSLHSVIRPISQQFLNSQSSTASMDARPSSAFVAVNRAQAVAEDPLVRQTKEELEHLRLQWYLIGGMKFRDERSDAREAESFESWQRDWWTKWLEELSKVKPERGDEDTTWILIVMIRERFRALIVEILEGRITTRQALSYKMVRPHSLLSITALQFERRT